MGENDRTEPEIIQRKRNEDDELPVGLPPIQPRKSNFAANPAEESWLSSGDHNSMVPHLITHRKQRLFAAACCRPHYGPSYESLFRVIEDFADGEITDSDLERHQFAFSKVDDALRNAGAREKDFHPLRVANVTALMTVIGPGAERDSLAIRARQAALVRCLAGNPFRPVTLDSSWRTSTVVALAQGIYDDRAFDRLPILADALQDAGCDSDDILNHCRDTSPHARGCWVVDLVLGKT